MLVLANRPLLLRALERLKYILNILTCVAFFYLALWGILKQSLYPDGENYQLTCLAIILTVGFLMGELITVIKLPNIVGMTIAGIVSRNLPGQWSIAASIDNELMSVLRNVALAIIMLKAGMDMDLAVLSRLKSACLRLALFPGAVETVVTALLSQVLLGLPWLWGLAAGFMLNAVSPAVVVPTCVYLQRNRFGTEKGIPTLILASASFDDVAAIAGFSVCCAVIFSTQASLAWTILQGPSSVLIGLLYGLIVGTFFWFLQNENGSNLLRGLLLIAASLGVTYGSEALDFESAGAIGCLAVGATAVKPWRNHAEKHKTLDEAMETLWMFLENMLFVLIGASVDFSLIDTEVLFKAIGTLLITHVIRVAATVISMYGVGLNNREKIFIALAWLPKATVQAALGSVALDIARSRGSEQDTVYGRAVLTLAVLSILLTAPLGAAVTNLLATKLLTQENSRECNEIQQNSRNREESSDGVDQSSP